MINNSHLSLITPWTDYAAGTVDGCYPVPVEANSLIELAQFEGTDHKSGFVYVFLDEKFNSGYMGENMERKAPQIKMIAGQEFDTTVGKINETILHWEPGTTNKITMAACTRYGFDKIFEESAPTVTDLILKLAAAGVTGTVNISFRNYPNGWKCHPEIVKKFAICL